MIQNNQETSCKYWATCSSIRLHRSLIRLLRPACFARALCCAHLLAHSLAHSMPSSWECEWLNVSKWRGFVPQRRAYQKRNAGSFSSISMSNCCFAFQFRQKSSSIFYLFFSFFPTSPLLHPPFFFLSSSCSSPSSSPANGSCCFFPFFGFWQGFFCDWMQVIYESTDF